MHFPPPSPLIYICSQYCLIPQRSSTRLQQRQMSSLASELTRAHAVQVSSEQGETDRSVRPPRARRSYTAWNMQQKIVASRSINYLFSWMIALNLHRKKGKLTSFIYLDRPCTEDGTSSWEMGSTGSMAQSIRARLASNTSISLIAQLSSDHLPHTLRSNMWAMWNITWRRCLTLFTYISVLWTCLGACLIYNLHVMQILNLKVWNHYTTL